MLYIQPVTRVSFKGSQASNVGTTEVQGYLSGITDWFYCQIKEMTHSPPWSLPSFVDSVCSAEWNAGFEVAVCGSRLPPAILSRSLAPVSPGWIQIGYRVQSHPAVLVLNLNWHPGPRPPFCFKRLNQGVFIAVKITRCRWSDYSDVNHKPNPA